MSKESEQPLVNVQSAYSKIEHYVEENQKSITIVVGVVICIIVAYFAYQKLYVDPQEKEAQVQLFMAERYFSKDSLRLAINGDGNYLGFKDIIDEYSVTPSANLAHYYLGICYLRQKQYEEAINYLKDFETHDQILYSIANGAIGDAYLELNQTENAVNYYLSAANDKQNLFSTPVYLMKAALAYELLGKYDKAAGLYEKITKDFPSTQENRDAEKYLARAKAAAGKL